MQRELVLYVHILLGMMWLGGILFIGWGVFPAVKKLSYSTQREYLYAIMKHAHLLLIAAGIGVISTGVMLASLLGPISSTEALFHTRYGQLVSFACIIALASLLWGAFISYPYTINMLKNRQLWEYAERGGIQPLKRKMHQVTFISSIEVIGLCIVVWLMVLL